MKQIFIIGSSSAYGVGASSAGWADLVKQYFHEKMYKNDGVGEKYEVYNFAKSGATIDFAIENFSIWQKQYYRGNELIAIVNIGGNNSKAEQEPENFVSTIDEFTEQMSKLLKMLKESCYKVLFIGNSFVDEAKTNPKPNPLTGGRSYFTNERRRAFSQRTKEICEQMNIDYVDVEVTLEEWLSKFIYDDGLHPNQAGHQLIFDEIKKKLEAGL